MTKAEQARLVAWRHRILQFAADGDRSVSRACRHFGISRKTFYKWKGRYGAHGAAGLCDRPRAPLRSPRATAADALHVEFIDGFGVAVDLRESQFLAQLVALPA